MIHRAVKNNHPTFCLIEKWAFWTASTSRIDSVMVLRSEVPNRFSQALFKQNVEHSEGLRTCVDVLWTWVKSLTWPNMDGVNTYVWEHMRSSTHEYMYKVIEHMLSILCAWGWPAISTVWSLQLHPMPDPRLILKAMFLQMEQVMGVGTCVIFACVIGRLGFTPVLSLPL